MKKERETKKITTNYNKLSNGNPNREPREQKKIKQKQRKQTGEFNVSVLKKIIVVTHIVGALERVPKNENHLINMTKQMPVT